MFERNSIFNKDVTLRRAFEFIVLSLASICAQSNMGADPCANGWLNSLYEYSTDGAEWGGCWGWFFGLKGVGARKIMKIGCHKTRGNCI